MFFVAGDGDRAQVVVVVVGALHPQLHGGGGGGNLPWTRPKAEALVDWPGGPGDGHQKQMRYF